MAEIIVALDLDTPEEADRLVARIGEAVGFYKVGAQLFTAVGPDVVRRLRDRGKRVFLDLKYHDIPNTVSRAVEAAIALEVDLLTLHASGGSAMMRAAREVAEGRTTRLVGVTLLTSFTAEDVVEVWDKELRSLREEVARLTALAVDAGLDGVVASALEAESLKRRYGPEFLVVTPGIRPDGEVVHSDQARIARPADAVRAGSDYLVVGRPVYLDADPAGVVERMRAEIEGALETAAE